MSNSPLCETLLDLETVLRSRKGQATMTIQEANILMTWKTQTLRNFTIGFGGGSLVSFLATRRLNQISRTSLSLAVGGVCGFSSFDRSAEPFIERILSLEGSRLQRELANILLTKYNNDPSVLQHLPKYFYSEEVYEDSFVDKPKFRWRIRNFYGDSVTHSQSESNREQINYSNKNDTRKKTTVESEQVNALTAGDAENPFDFMFGLPESVENTSSAISNTKSRRQSRREKRFCRRHRRLQREDSET